MCRIFGFRSVIQSQVHSSLVQADNALMYYGGEHPDGWGVAYYLENAPHIIKSVSSALQDQLFRRVSGIVASQTVIAHLRKATAGDLNILNTHPFQYGSWTFAHNGNIKNFSRYQDALTRRIAPSLRRFLLGDTDSEVIFYLILTHLQRRVDALDGEVSVNDLAAAVHDAVDEVTSIVGPYEEEDGDPDKTYLTCLVTNGVSMVGFQGGKSLLYSTYKTRCPDRDVCPSFSAECEAPTQTGSVNHLVVSSEPLLGENVWLSLDPGELVGVDRRMNFTKLA